MAEKSLFWNARLVGGDYDRKYNADDISNWLATVLTTGVIKSDTGLKVTATGGMVVSVDLGKAVINGKPYTNDTAVSFTVPTAPTSATPRIDLIVLRYDSSVNVRETKLVYIQGGSNGSIPAIKRSGAQYDLVLAKITVAQNATAINAGDIVDLRGDKDSTVTTTTGSSLGFCPYLTAVKGYDDYYDAIVLHYEDEITMETAGTVINFDIPQYGWTGVDRLTVYTNGMRENPDNYTITNNRTITFKALKVAGTKIQVVVEKTIDGEGLGTALEQYLQLQAIVLDLHDINEFTYVCNGVNDNVAISTIVKAFLEGGNDYKSMKLKVYGNIGVSAPVRGSGTSTSMYGWFDFAPASASNRKIIIDFTNCSAITPTIDDGTRNVIFFGENMDIIGVNIIVNNSTSGTQVRIFNSSAGSLKCERSRFWITAYQDSGIAINGTFIDCRGSVATTINNSYCFLPSNTGLLRLIGGEYYAYTGSSSLQSSIVGQSSADSVSILYGVSAPTVSRSGYYQTNSLLQWAGGGLLNCTDLVSALPMIVVSGISNIRGTITKSKAIE